MPAPDNKDSETFAVLLELKEVPDHPMNKYKGDELGKMVYFRTMADPLVITPSTGGTMSIFCANYLPALVDKFLEPPPSPHLSQDLQAELQLNNVYFQTLFFLQQRVHPYWLKYLRSKKEAASKNQIITRVMTERALKVIPIWLRLDYPDQLPDHWPSDPEGFFSAVPPSSQVLWMLASLVGGFIKESNGGEILPTEIKKDLIQQLTKWSQYKEPRFARACTTLLMKFTPEGIQWDKTAHLGAYGVREEWRTCGARGCNTQGTTDFKLCGAEPLDIVPKLIRNNIGK